MAFTREDHIRKVQAMFAHANNDGNSQDVRDNAMALAYEYMAKMKLDKGDVYGQKNNEEYVKVEGISFGKRRPTEWAFINGILTEFFNIQTIAGTPIGQKRQQETNSILFIGKPLDVEIAKLVANQLLVQYRELWEVYKQVHNLPTTEKRMYYNGLFSGLMARLRGSKKKVEQELGLVIVENIELKQAFEKFYPKVVKTSSVKFSGRATTIADGKRDSEKIQLNKGITDAANSSNTIKVLC